MPYLSTQLRLSTKLCMKLLKCFEVTYCVLNQNISEVFYEARGKIRFLTVSKYSFF